MTTATKLPPLSVLLAPREHAFASSCHGAGAYACCPAYHQLQHHHQVQHYQEPQHYSHYQYPSSEGSVPSAPGSPASPTWWGGGASHTLQRASYAPQPSSAPFWKHTSGLEAFRTASLSISSSSNSSSSSRSSSPASDVSMEISYNRPVGENNSAGLLAGLAVPESVAAAPVISSSTGIRPKKSRYLREMDRRAIIRRLDMGEKQCALAREFSVSRSSICNLFKHRAEVLSRAAHQSPFSKHPKKCKKQTTAPRRRFA